MAELPDKGGTATATSKLPPKGSPINDPETLKKVLPNYANMGLIEILNKISKAGYHIGADFYKVLQTELLTTEAQTGVPVAVQALGGQLATEQYQNALQAASSAAGSGASDAAALERLQQQLAAEAEENRLQREFEAQQQEANRQAQLRLQRLSALTDLVGQFAGLQQRSRETLAGLQGDPFAFAAAKQGLASQGTTPVQSFGQDLRSFIGQPLPTIDPNAPLSNIEAQIQGLQGFTGPLPPNVFGGLSGMAGGGQVSGSPQRVLVGERGPEVVEGSDFKVMPLTGSAQGGYDTSTLLPALAPLYSGLGFQSIPTPQRATAGFGLGPSGGAAAAERLGYRPALIGNFRTGQAYYRNPITGQLQYVPSDELFRQSGFRYEDVFQVEPNELGSFGAIGPALTAKPQTPIPGQLSPFGPLSQPIIEPTTGAILPAPYRAAATLNYLRLTNPAFYQLALSAYAHSIGRVGDPNALLGYNQQALEAEIGAALPQGREHGLIGLR